MKGGRGLLLRRGMGEGGEGKGREGKREGKRKGEQGDPKGSLTHPHFPNPEKYPNQDYSSFHATFDNLNS